MTLQNQYPMVHKLLNDYIRAGTGEDNLFMTLYGFVSSADKKFVKQLVDEFETLSEDDEISNEELLREFNTDLDEDYMIMTDSNARALLINISEFVSYIHSSK